MFVVTVQWESEPLHLIQVLPPLPASIAALINENYSLTMLLSSLCFTIARHV